MEAHTVPKGTVLFRDISDTLYTHPAGETQVVYRSVRERNPGENIDTPKRNGRQVGKAIIQQQKITKTRPTSPPGDTAPERTREPSLADVVEQIANSQLNTAIAQKLQQASTATIESTYSISRKTTPTSSATTNLAAMTCSWM